MRAINLLSIFYTYELPKIINTNDRDIAIYSPDINRLRETRSEILRHLVYKQLRHKNYDYWIIELGNGNHIYLMDDINKFKGMELYQIYIDTDYLQHLNPDRFSLLYSCERRGVKENGI